MMLPDTLTTIRVLEDLSKKKTVLHQVHPFANFIVTLFFIAITTSFEKHQCISLLPLFLFPIISISLGDIPLSIVTDRLIIVLPFIIGLGILNPLFDKTIYLVSSIYINGGWLIFISLIIKCFLCVSSTIILISICGINGIGIAMNMIHIPKVIILILLMMYRYLSLLVEEITTITKACSLRNCQKTSIPKSARGSLPGTVLIRTWERGLTIYDAMRLRGFNGKYNSEKKPFVFSDFVYILLWVSYFFIARFINIPEFIGSFF